MLKDWPVEKLINLANSKETVFMFFPRGEILVKDSHFLENLVIVKSGSVRVLKKMKQHQPNTQDSKKAIETARGTGRKADKQRDDEFLFLPPIKTSNEDKNDGCYVLTEVRVPKRLDHADDIEPELPVSSHVTAVHRQSLHVVLRRNGSGSGCSGDENYTRRLAEEYRERLHGRKQLEEGDRPKDERTKKRTSRNDKESEEEKKMIGRKHHMRKITEDLESNRSVITDSESETEVDSHPKFIHIQTMRKGEVFGLANLMLEDQPSLCAVSDGAECILVNKKLYLRHAPDKLIALLKLTCVPYPSENELNEKLEKSVSWRKYKDRILAKTMNDIISSSSSARFRNNESRSLQQQRHRRTHSSFNNQLGI